MRLRKMYSWEKYAIETYHDIGESGIEEVLLRQCFINAREIDLAEDWNISEQDFPWHGYSYTDFNRLNNSLQGCIEYAKKCKSMRDVRRFIKRHKAVYKAFFERPIRVYEKGKNAGYKFGSDGRHRIFVAQQNNTEIPVWIVEWVDVSKMTRDEYIKSFCGGCWRFYEDAEIDEERIRQIKEQNFVELNTDPDVCKAAIDVGTQYIESCTVVVNGNNKV